MTTKRRKRRLPTLGEAVAFWLGLALRNRLGAVGWGLFLSPFLVVGYVYAQWSALPPVGQWLIGTLVVTLAGMWLQYHWGALRWLPRRLFAGRGSSPAPEFLPRTQTDPFWVYILTEWRDRQEYLMSREQGRNFGTKHLVYVGKANDFEPRMVQHQADKAWWHDELEFQVIRCFSEAEALSVERGIIERQAKATRLEERPRENKQWNSSYDPARSEAMRRKARVLSA